MALDIASILGGSLGTVVSDIIGKFKADPNKVLEMQGLVVQNQAALDMKQLELQGKLQDAVTAEIQAASGNIQAEAKGNWFTSGARPMFLYICEVTILYNYVISPLVHKAQHLDLPPQLVWLFGSVMLGYTGARTWEKFMGLPGDSSMQIGPFKVGNKQ